MSSSWEARLRRGRAGGVAVVDLQDNDTAPAGEGAIAEDALARLRFYVAAPSVSAVRKALFRAPGGARVVGRFDRETIECAHTMNAHGFSRHWPIVLSRLGKAGLRVVPRPTAEP